jgi:hypothetical protein
MKPGPKGLWPVRCAPIGAVAVGSVLWRYAGELRCTAIVKATFALVESGEMTRLNPQPIRRSDDYLSGRPSLAGAAEIAPRVPSPEVVVVANAYALGGPVEKRSVRLTLVAGQKITIDKTLFVYGDRAGDGAPKPFERMRIGYERALGGLTCADNPVGVGLEDDSSRRPNLVDPKAPDERVAGFGPMPALFPRRRRLRGSIALDLMEQGIVDYPSDFDFSYFQTAPIDQRLERLRGDEWLFLEGLHPRFERVRARLPHAIAHAQIYGSRPSGVPEMVPLAADLLHVEPDHDRCSIAWRGDVVLPNELSAEGIAIAGAVQIGDERIVWPADHMSLEAQASPSAPAILGARADDFQPTAEVADHQPQRALGVGYRLDGERLKLADPPSIGDTIQPPAAAHEIVVPSLAAPQVPRFDGTEMIVDDDDLMIDDELVADDFGKTDPMLEDDLADTIDRAR